MEGRRQKAECRNRFGGALAAFCFPLSAFWPFSASPRLRGEKSSVVLALTLTLLIAAAGPLSQTLRLVRADPRAAVYRLVFSGAWTEAAPHSGREKPSGTKMPAKPAPSLQALSGYWDTASAFQAPGANADVPPQPLLKTPQPLAVPSPLCIALPAAESPPSFLPSSRGPPRA